MQWLNIGEVLYCPCIFLIKAAIVLQYLQILVPVRTANKTLFYGGWAVIIATFILEVAAMPLTFFLCTPREKIWNSHYKGGKCMNVDGLILSSAIFNITSDLVILLLPVRSVLKLQIDVHKKVGIILLFGTGLLSVSSHHSATSHSHHSQGHGRFCDEDTVHDHAVESGRLSRYIIRNDLDGTMVMG
jgi:hypothetical protein